jgi:endonuclease-3
MEEWLPREAWERTTLTLIAHGQETCDAKKPRCGECPVATTCPSAGTFDGARAAPEVSQGKLRDVEDLAL